MDIKDYALIKKATLTDIGDAIREKEGSAELIPEPDMAARVREISGGFPWEDTITRVSLYSLNKFGKKSVKLHFKKCSNLDNFITAAANEVETDRINTTVEELEIRSDAKIQRATSMISYNNFHIDLVLRKLTLHLDLSQVTSIDGFVKNLRALESIEGDPLDFSSAIYGGTSFATSTPVLKEIRFTGVIIQSMELTSTVLSKDSIVSMMICLSAEVIGKTLTLSKEAVDKAFETSPGAADGSDSAEWQNLVASKPNWTISLKT